MLKYTRTLIVLWMCVSAPGGVLSADETNKDSPPPGRKPEHKRLAANWLKTIKTAKGPARLKAVRSCGDFIYECPEIVPTLVRIACDPTSSEDLSHSAFAYLRNARRPFMKPEQNALLKVMHNQKRSKTVRNNAMKLFAQKHSALVGTVPAVVETQFPDGSNNARWRLLQLLGPGQPEDMNPLVKLLGHKHPKVRSGAADCLGYHKQAAKLVIPKLLKSLRNEKIASVRCALLKALGHIAEANPNAATITIQSLKDPDNTVRCAAVAALGQLHGPKDARITAIAKVMTDPSQEIRMQAIKSIRAIGANTPNALLQIQTALKDKDEHVRYEAIQSLTDLCNTPGKTNARESLTPILTNNDRHDFGAISEVIETSGSKAKWAVSILMKMLVDKKHTDIRYSIAHTLTYIGPAAIDAAPKLNKLLLQSDEYFYTAAKVLGSIGAANAAATGKIISVFNDVKRSKSIRIAAAGAILGIAPSDAKVTRQAADFLTHIVKTNRQWYKAKEFKTPRDREIARSMANQAKKYLMSQKPLSRPAASLLQDQLQDIVNEVRSIAGFYPYPSLAVDYAAKLVRSDDRTLAHTGIAVLIWIMKTGYVDYDLKKLAASDPTFWKINPFLKRIMKYPSLYDVHLRKHAIETLGRLGPSAKQAVPHLQEMTKWKDLRLRPIARKALNNIQAKPQQKKSNSANG